MKEVQVVNNNTKHIKLNGLPVKINYFIFIFIIIILNLLLTAYTYNDFINKTKEFSLKEGNKICGEVLNRLIEIESIVNYFEKIILPEDSPKEIIEKLARIHSISANITNEYNIKLNGIYFSSNKNNELFSKDGKINNNLYIAISKEVKKAPKKFIVSSIPNNMNFNGLILSKSVNFKSGEYIGSIHILLTDLFLENMINAKITKETKYLIINKDGNLVAASDKEIISAHQEKIDISYGDSFFKFSKYVMPYKRTFFLNELTLWSGVDFYELLDRYKYKLLDQIIILNIIIISLLILYYILLIKGMNLCYKQLRIDNQKFLEKRIKAQELILSLKTEVMQLRKYIDILKCNYSLESNFIKDLMNFECSKLNDSINTSIVIKKYIGEHNNSNISLKKLSDLIDIIISNNEKQFFLNFEYSKDQLDVTEVFTTVINFYEKISYEKNIKINLNLVEGLDGVFIEQKFLEYILISIIGHMLKGIGKNNEIIITVSKAIKNKQEILEITLSDNGFGVNLDDIFNVGNSPLNILGATSLCLSSIETCNKVLKRIGGKIITLGDQDKVNRGSKYILSLPTKFDTSQKSELKKEGNVIYLYE